MPIPRPGLLPTPTEQVYGVSLLDDLHNYFPDLLYNANYFHSVDDVLSYIAERTEARFNLYQYGRSHYQEPAAAAAAAAAPARQRQGFETPPPQRRQYAAAAAAGAAATPQRTASVASGGGWGGSGNGAASPAPLPSASNHRTATSVAITQLLYSLLAQPATFTIDEYQIPFSPAQSDVPVVPTAQQILRATSTVTLQPDTVCSVCQAEFEHGERGTKINHCSHTFHNECIRRWFQENVRCPNCNYDIRDDTPAVAAAPAPATAAAAAHSTMDQPD